MADLSNVDLLSLAETDTTLRRTASTEGGNYAGQCPVCGDKDDFYVLPEHTGNDGKQRGQCACRECHPQRMDAIGYLQWARKMSYKEVVEYLHEMYSLELPDNWGKSGKSSLVKKSEPTAPVYRIKPLPMNATPPAATWQTRAKQAVARAQQLLVDEKIGKEARDYLHGRGLIDETIRAAGLGFVVEDTFDDPIKWGLDPEDVEKVYIPRGILFPYIYKGEIWKIRIRRLGDDIPKEKRYRMVSGSANGLYRADELKVNDPALLFEGEIDALSVAQEIGDLAACVATGSTSHARIDRWKARLVLASQVLLCFDNDAAGQEAITYWSKRLGEIATLLQVINGYKDANDMLQSSVDLRTWVTAKLVIPNDTDETKSSPQVLATVTSAAQPASPKDAITEAVAFLDDLMTQGCCVRYYENGQCGLTVPELWNDAQFETVAQSVAVRDAMLRRLIPCSPGAPTAFFGETWSASERRIA